MSTATLDTSPDVELGDRIVTEVNAARERRVDAESARWDDWTRIDSWRRYMRVVESIRVERTGEREVTAWVRDTPDGRLWGYVAAEVLDAGSSYADPDEITFRTGRIHHDSRTRYRLTW